MMKLLSKRGKGDANSVSETLPRRTQPLRSDATLQDTIPTFTQGSLLDTYYQITFFISTATRHTWLDPVISFHGSAQNPTTDLSIQYTSFTRRRGPNSNTRNACLNCKKARAKCDGNKPCKRCITRLKISECVYEIHIKIAKVELVKQIKALQAKNNVVERILKALTHDEKESQILKRLKTGDTYDSIVEWLGHSSAVDFETLSSQKSYLPSYTSSEADNFLSPSGQRYPSTTQ
ncbi:hypothetical protein WAI453_006467 [Rhynchosporium graminicola]